MTAPSVRHMMEDHRYGMWWREGGGVADKSSFVGVFDSGVGGISVLRHLVDELPHEDFCYFGDSANNPYGGKTPNEILSLSRGIVDDMAARGAKAVVIACNTATSVAAARLRLEYPDLPIVGVEPAIRPATRAPRHERILVMATQVTLALDKYHRLAEECGSSSQILGEPCVGLAHRIEQGNLDAPDLHGLIETLVGRYRGTVDSVVLGCTHYPFVRAQIRDVVGDVPLFDGGAGAARRLRSLLAERDLLAEGNAPGSVAFASSLRGPGQLDLYERFFRLEV